jgi:PAS domain S-box-containing protein
MAERPPASRLDPAVTLESLRGSAGYPPGLYGVIRRRLPIYALVGAGCILLGLIPFPHDRTVEVLIGGSLFFATTLAAVLIPWSRVPLWVWTLVPLAYVAVIAIVRDAQGGTTSGLTGLFILPIVWIAFYGRRAQLVVGLAAVALALAVPALVVGDPNYPTSNWKGLLVLMVVVTLVAFTILTMVARDRDYVADLAEQSLLAQEAARRATTARDRIDSVLRAATGTAIVGCNPEGLITFFSSGAEAMLGYRRNEVVGIRTVFDLLDPEELERRMGPARSLDLPEGNTPWGESAEDMRWTYVRKDGTRRRAGVSVTRAAGDDGSPSFVIVAVDVTDREELASERDRLLAVEREVTEVLAEQNHRLRELTKMKDDLVATVSHELRTPLTSIRGFVELLLEDDARLDPDQVRMIRTIDRNSRQLMAVAEDLLADPGGAPGLRVHFVDTDLAVLAHEAVEAMAAPAADRRLTLGVAADGPLVVHGDPSRLHQLLDNLLSNACKFTPPGGRILVRVTRQDRYACLDVHDDGPGIPPAERSQLFERFYRLASPSDQGIPGSGLGLAIVKSVAESHDGTVDIVDAPGWSTTFRVLLPLPEAPARTEGAAAISA